MKAEGDNSDAEGGNSFLTGIIAGVVLAALAAGLAFVALRRREGTGGAVTGLAASDQNAATTAANDGTELSEVKARWAN